MSGNLYRLIYCSRNVPTESPETMRIKVEQILEVARRNNAHFGITGALLFNRGCFAQVLEGPQDNVERVFEEISCDLRHKDLAILEIGPVETRSFPDWSMAYAGMLEDDRTSFVALTLAPSDGASTVLDVLNALVLREEGPSGAAP
jgi:hypothetical protein